MAPARCVLRRSDVIAIRLFGALLEEDPRILQQASEEGSSPAITMRRITQIAKKFDRQSQASSVLLFFVVLTSIKFVLGIEHIQDVGLWDETDYLYRGVQIPQWGLPDPSWSPLYSVWYYLLSFIEPDRLRLYYLNYQVLVVSTVAAFYLFLRTLTINPYVSTCAAIWLLLSNVPCTWPFNGLFALLLLLVCLTLVMRVSSEETSYLIVGLGTAAVTFVRPEFFLSLILLSAWLGRDYGRSHRWNIGIESRTKIALFVVAVASLFLLFGNPLTGTKTWMAFGQHFSLHYVAWNGLSIDPWTGWAEVMRAAFGDATSIWQAAVHNSGAFLRHVIDNFGTYILATIVQPFVRPLAFLAPSEQSVLAFVQIGILGGLGLFLFRARTRQVEIVTRPFGGRLVVAAIILYLPNLVAALIFYPRWHYLVTQTALLLAGAAALVSAAIKSKSFHTPPLRTALMFGVTLLVITPNAGRGWLLFETDRDPGQAWDREQELRVAERRIDRSIPSRWLFENYWTGGPLTRIDHPLVPERIHEIQAVINMIRSLDIDAQVNLLGAPSGYHVYLADNYHDVPAGGKQDTPFMKYLEQNETNMIVISETLVNAQGYIDDLEFKRFLKNAEAARFRRVDIPASNSWLLVEVSLL